MQAVRERPALLGWLVLYLAASFGLLVAVLAITGHMSAFGTLAVFPAIFSGALFGAKLNSETR
jgi:hypothetical protein